MSFVLTRLAANDLNEIWEYLASDNIEAADRVLAALERCMRKLVAKPGLGHFGKTSPIGGTDFIWCIRI